MAEPLEARQLLETEIGERLEPAAAAQQVLGHLDHRALLRGRAEHEREQLAIGESVRAEEAQPLARPQPFRQRLDAGVAGGASSPSLAARSVASASSLMAPHESIAAPGGDARRRARARAGQR